MPERKYTIPAFLCPGDSIVLGDSIPNSMKKERWRKDTEYGTGNTVYRYQMPPGSDSMALQSFNIAQVFDLSLATRSFPNAISVIVDKQTQKITRYEYSFDVESLQSKSTLEDSVYSLKYYIDASVGTKGKISKDTSIFHTRLENDTTYTYNIVWSINTPRDSIKLRYYNLRRLVLGQYINIETIDINIP